MIPVHQTRFGADNGNCHAACLASILEVPLDEVPNPTPEELVSDEAWAGYTERLHRDFLHPRNLHSIPLMVGAVEGGTYKPPGYSVLCGRSPRHDGFHAVVAKDGEIVFDPHPDGTGIGEWNDWTVFVVLDPAKPAGVVG